MDLPGRGGGEEEDHRGNSWMQRRRRVGITEQAVRNKVREVPLRRLLKWSHERRGKEMLTYMLV